MTLIRSYTPKLNKLDRVRVDLAIKHYTPHLDFGELLRGWVD